MELAQFAYIALVILMGSGWGLISLWATTSNSPWALRGCVLSLLLSLFLTVPAYEPILFFVIQFVAVAIGVAVWSHLRGNEFGSATFSLRALLLSMALAGLLISVAVRSEIPSAIVWSSLFAGSVSFAVTTLLAAWLTRCPWKWRRLAASIGIMAVTAAPMGLWDAMLLNFPEWDRHSTSVSLFRGATVFQIVLAHFAAWSTALVIALLIMVVALLGVRGLRSPNSRTQWFARICIGLVASLVSLPTLVVLMNMPSPTPIPQPHDPSGPDGYAELLKARNFYVASGALDDPASATDKQLALAMKQNQKAFAQVRHALALPFATNMADLDNNTMMADVHIMRSLARMMLADAMLHQRQDRFDEAVTNVLEVAELSKKVEDANLTLRGEIRPTMMSLMSFAIEGMAQTSLVDMRSKLGTIQSRRVIDFFSEVDARRTPLEKVVAADKEWAQRQWGWRAQLYESLSLLLQSEDPLHDIKSRHRQATLQAVATRRLICVELAIRDYQRKHDKLPDSLEELSIEERMLIDPFSADGDVFRYGLDDTNYILYSVGPDGADDSGKAMETAAATIGDFLLESMSRYE